VSRPRTHLTIAEVCDELGVSRSTFYDWRAKGRGPRSLRLPNGEIRIRRTELDNWLTGCEEA
jgi:excisionase family DNA binding protein